MIQYPDLESNQDLNLRRVPCDPLHHRDMRADDWICTSMNRFTRPVPFSVEPRRQKHEREESNPVQQFWRLPALPGAHSCMLLIGHQGIRRESNPYLLVHSQACSNRYTTDTMSIQQPDQDSNPELLVRSEA